MEKTEPYDPFLSINIRQVHAPSTPFAINSSLAKKKERLRECRVLCVCKWLQYNLCIKPLWDVRELKRKLIPKM